MAATKHNIPCYGCAERNEICHTKAYGCEKWAEYEAKHQAELAERESRFELMLAYEGYKSDSIARGKRRKNRT